jgi:serine/threonine protein kinase
MHLKPSSVSTAKSRPSRLNDPNICTFYDVGHQNGIDYLVTELLEGETLADRLASRRKYSATAS